MLYTLDNGIITTMHVSADDVATSLLSIANLNTGILPENALWYLRKELFSETAIFMPAGVHKVALALDPFKPPKRFVIPAPPLVFICASRQPPKVYAVKERPKSFDTPIFNAPFYNIYHDGRTCAGTNQYPEDVALIPASFFMSFFSLSLERRASVKHPDSLYALWMDLKGKKDYPLNDLVPCGALKDVV